MKEGRVSLVVHVDAASAPATLVEWWKPLDGDTESQGLRFDDPSGGPWLDKEELPPTIIAAGALVTDVVGTAGLPGLQSDRLGAGYRVHIEPHPGHPTDRNALAIWSDDRQHIGYLPSDVAANVVAESRRRQTKYSAIVLRDYRNAETGARTGIKLLLGPGAVWAKEPG